MVARVAGVITAVAELNAELIAEAGPVHVAAAALARLAGVRVIGTVTRAGTGVLTGLTETITAHIALVTGVAGVVAAVSHLDTGFIAETAAAEAAAFTRLAGVGVVGAVPGAVARVLSVQRLTFVVAAALAAVSSA